LIWEVERKSGKLVLSRYFKWVVQTLPFLVKGKWLNREEVGRYIVKICANDDT